MANYDCEQYKQRIKDLLADDPEPSVSPNLQEVRDRIRARKEIKASLPANFEAVNQKLKDHQPNQ